MMNAEVKPPASAPLKRVADFIIHNSPFIIPTITPVLGEPTRFWVDSLTQAGVVHLVDLDDDGQPACSCQDFMCRGRVCKHIKAVQKTGLTTEPQSHREKI